MISAETDFLLGSLFVVCSTFPEMMQVLRSRLTRDVNLYLLVFAIVGLAFYVHGAYQIQQWAFFIGDSIDLSMWSVVLYIKLKNVYKGRELGEEFYWKFWMSRVVKA